MRYGFTSVHKINMKNLFLGLFLIVGSLKGQVTQKPMYPQDRTMSCATGVCAAGVSYPLFWSMYGGSNNKDAHFLATLSSAGVSVAMSLIAFNYGPKNDSVNSRQNSTACLVSSAVTITLVRIGIGNNK